MFFQHIDNEIEKTRFNQSRMGDSSPRNPLILASCLWLAILLCLFPSHAVADPPLVISQINPDAFTGDPEGRTYRITISNPAGTEAADNLAVEIDIRSPEFAYVAESLTALDGLVPVAVNVSGADPLTVAFPAGYSLQPGHTVTIDYRLSTACTATEGDYPTIVTAEYDGGGSDVDSDLITVIGRSIELSLTNVSPAGDPFTVSMGDTVRMRAGNIRISQMPKRLAAKSSSTPATATNTRGFCSTAPIRPPVRAAISKIRRVGSRS